MSGTHRCSWEELQHDMANSEVLTPLGNWCRTTIANSYAKQQHPYRRLSEGEIRQISPDGHLPAFPFGWCYLNRKTDSGWVSLHEKEDGGGDRLAVSFVLENSRDYMREMSITLKGFEIYSKSLTPPIHPVVGVVIGMSLVAMAMAVLLSLSLCV